MWVEGVHVANFGRHCQMVFRSGHFSPPTGRVLEFWLLRILADTWRRLSFYFTHCSGADGTGSSEQSGWGATLAGGWL